MVEGARAFGLPPYIFIGTKHGAASQTLLARILLSYPNAKILQFDASGITEVGFEDTEHFAVTRDFLHHHKNRLERLLADD